MNRQALPNSPAGSEDEASAVLEGSGVSVHLGLLLQLVVFGAVGLLLMLLAPEAPWSIKLLIIGMVFLTLKRWGGVIVLLLVQADLYFRESQPFSALQGIWGVYFVLLVLMVLMLVARHRLLLRQNARESVFRLIKDLLLSSELPRSTVESAGPGFLTTRMISSGFRGTTLLLCCVIAARILLSFVPRPRELTENLRGLIDADPSITMGAILIVSIVASWIVASEISWRQMTPAQARVYLRSNFLRYHYRDLRMIVVRRIRRRMKRIAASKAGKANE